MSWRGLRALAAFAAVLLVSGITSPALSEGASASP
jgi:hypothetical protein